MSEPFTIPQLDRLIDLAVELRFPDDVAHWKAMRARLVAEQASQDAGIGGES